MKNYRNYLYLESPDKTAEIEFAGTSDNLHRACTIKITVENGKLHVYATGCDDRTTILIDEVADIPEENQEH